MSKEKLDEIKQKKKELQAELDKIQDELDHSLDEVRTDMTDKLRPTEIIKSYPIPSVGVALLLGFLAGHRPKGSSSASGSNHSKEGFTSLLITELKKLATRKAVSAATDYIDQFLDEKRGEVLNGANGTGNDEE